MTNKPRDTICIQIQNGPFLLTPLNRPFLKILTITCSEIVEIKSKMHFSNLTPLKYINFIGCTYSYVLKISVKWDKIFFFKSTFPSELPADEPLVTVKKIIYDNIKLFSTSFLLSLRFVIVTENFAIVLTVLSYFFQILNIEARCLYFEYLKI